MSGAGSGLSYLPKRTYERHDKIPVKSDGLGREIFVSETSERPRDPYKLLLDLPIRLRNGQIQLTKVIADTAGYPTVSMEYLSNFNMLRYIKKKVVTLLPFGKESGASIISEGTIDLIIEINPGDFLSVEFAVVKRVSSVASMMISLRELDDMGWSKPLEQGLLRLGMTQRAFPFTTISAKDVDVYVNEAFNQSSSNIPDNIPDDPIWDPYDGDGESIFSIDVEDFIPEKEKINDEKEDLSTSTPIRLKKMIRLKPHTQVYVEVEYDKKFLSKHKMSSGVVVPSQVISGSALKVASGYWKNKSKYLLISNWGEDEVCLKSKALLGHLVVKEFQLFSLDEKYDGDENDVVYLPDKVGKEFRVAVDLEDGEELIPVEEFVKILGEKMSDEFDLEQRDKLTEFLVKWRILFSKDPTSPGVITKTECTVPLEDEKMTPIRRQYYRYSPTVVAAMRKAVEGMLAGKIIKPSDSPWSFPVVMVTKPDGNYRFCVDYSSLSKHVRRDAFALPRIDDYLDRLKDAEYMTVVDCSSGFWQIRVREDHQERLAFITPFGNYEFLVMPFGFTNAPGIFQRAITETLNSFLYYCVLVFVDDICVYSSSFAEHLEHLDDVFKQLEKFHWRLKIQKSQFACKVVDYLGFRVGKGAVRPLSKNIDKIRGVKHPENPDELRSFLGFTNYYKRFIKGYNYIIQPMRDLLRNGVTWEWNDETESAYQQMLELLCSDPILKLPDYSRLFIVKTDCSQYAWGAVLCQIYEDIEHPVYFASGSLSPAGRRWPTWKREGFAVFKAIMLWKHYLMGVPFHVFTDHKALLAILDPNRDLPPILDNWRVQLSIFAFQVFHRPGKELYLEDGMSRSKELLLMSVKSIASLQDEDSILGPLKKVVSSGIRGKRLTNQLFNYMKNNSVKLENFIVEDNLLKIVQPFNKKNPMRNCARVVLPEKALVDCLYHFHDAHLSGHMGLDKLWKNISADYWAPDLYTKCSTYHAACLVCANNKILRLKNSNPIKVTASSPLQIIELDHMIVKVPTPDGYCNILSVVDVYSQKLWLFPTKTVTPHETFQILLENIFLQDDFPQYFISDQHGAFDSALSNLICEAAGIVHEYNLPNRNTKGATGLIENKHRTVWLLLTKYVNEITQEDWKEMLPWALAAYNRTPCRAIADMRPNEVYYQRKLRNFIDFNKIEEFSGELSGNFTDYLADAKRCTEYINEALSQFRLENREKSLADSKTFTDWKVGMYARIKRRPEWTVADLNFKMASRLMGPYEIIGVNMERNRLTIKITSIKDFEIHADECVPAEEIDSSIVQFMPDLNECIPDRNIPVVEKINLKKIQYYPEKEKLNYNVKTIVGKRVSVWWSSNKKYWLGTVIGFDVNLHSNLVFYDERTKEVPVSEDFYKAYLYPAHEGSRRDTWKLVKLDG